MSLATVSKRKLGLCLLLSKNNKLLLLWTKHACNSVQTYGSTEGEKISLVYLCSLGAVATTVTVSCFSPLHIIRK